jgi:hypothetical protein
VGLYWGGFWNRGEVETGKESFEGFSRGDALTSRGTPTCFYLVYQKLRPSPFAQKCFFQTILIFEKSSLVCLSLENAAVLLKQSPLSLKFLDLKNTNTYNRLSLNKAHG